MMTHDALALRARLSALASAFDARSLRERVLMIAAVAGVLVALALPTHIDPLWQRLQQLGTQRDTLATALSQLQAEADSHQTRQRLTREQAAAELEALRQRHAPASPDRMSGEDATGAAGGAGGAGGLVGPEQMLPLLSQLLSRHSGLRVRALQSLGHAPWPDGAIGVRGVAAPEAAASARPSTPLTADAPRLYRHAVELQVEGSYVDLLAYLQTLEALPQRLLWGAMTLQVEQHPRVLLTLRLYTLSPRASWVAL